MNNNIYKTPNLEIIKEEKKMFCCEECKNPWIAVLCIIALLLLVYGLWQHKIWLIVIIVVIGIICHIVKRKPKNQKPRTKRKRR